MIIIKNKFYQTWLEVVLVIHAIQKNRTILENLWGRLGNLDQYTYPIVEISGMCGAG